MIGNDYGKVLGELETQIMELVWKEKEPVSVADIVQSLSKKRTIAYTTVMTIMGRLAEKGLLTRIPSGKAYLYKPAYSKDKFLTRVSRQIIKNFAASFGDTAIAHFTEELENLPSEKKQRLLKILNDKK